MTKERKILLFSIILLFVFLIFPSIVNAADTYTTTSTINDVTVNWSYTLNDSDQITDLTCTNPSDLTGSITIPSSLDGKTVVTIGHDAFESATGITEVIIPDSVTEIGYKAFENCTSLNKVDLGNITSLSFSVFKGCTSLTEITIPKTLKDGSVTPCLDNPNITKITLEEGLTIVPSNLCANTGITEIVIPDSVTEIGSHAFENCTELKKITILDNVTDMGFNNSSDSDSVFENHNEDLTIYCYEGSMAANYALKYGIKYVYLTKPADETPDDNDQTNDENNNSNPDKTDDENNNDTNNEIYTGKNDPTVAPGKIPYAGFRIGLTIIIILSVAGCIIAYMKYNKFKNI